MEDTLFLAVPIVVLVLSLTLSSTKAWWVMGALLLVGAAAIFLSIRPVEDDIGGIGAMGNGIAAIGAIVLGMLGTIVLVLSAWARNGFLVRQKGKQTPAVELPRATVVQ